MNVNHIERQLPVIRVHNKGLYIGNAIYLVIENRWFMHGKKGNIIEMRMDNCTTIVTCSDLCVS
ncbi:hypothetical protein MUGA111182_03490 [Mucilaginibacter galii]